MKRHVKILIWQLAVFVVITLLLIVVRFMMPWFVDSFMLDYSVGVGHLVAQVVPYVLVLLTLFAMPRQVGIRHASLRPEVHLISPILIVFGVLLVFAAQLVVAPLVSMIPSDFMVDISSDLVSSMESGFWPMFTFIFVIPLVEEWIYRGFIQTTLVGMMGIGWGLAIMAVLSGLGEIVPQTGIVMAASSFVYGSIYFVKRSLTTVYMIHVLCNGFSYLLYLFFGSAGLVREGLADYENLYVVAWAVSLILLVVTAWWVSRHNDKLRIKKFKKSE